MADKILKAEDNSNITSICKVFASLIKKGKKTLDEVPENLRDEVVRYLNEN